ncbi:unnamed protein product, partial [Tuber aestivum]
MDLLHRSDARHHIDKLDKIQTELGDTSHQARAVEVPLTKEIRLTRAIAENAPLLMIDDLKRGKAASEVLGNCGKCIESGGANCLWVRNHGWLGRLFFKKSYQNESNLKTLML